MRYTKLIFTLLVIISIYNISNIYAQESRGMIIGKVVDAVSKQPLPFVNVLLKGTQLGSSTNDMGEYKITNIPVGIYQVQASAIGYNTGVKTDITVKAASPTNVDIEIQESTIELQGVIATAGYFQKDPLELISVANLSYEEIRRAPGGLEDVVRAVSILPGVAQTDAGRNDLVVRGGAPSENLFLIDGIVVPNINHFGTQGATGGPLSFINLDFVKETSFSTGGFSAVYGDKLSSVLKIDLRDGRKDHIGGKALISASQFGFNVEGPLNDNVNFIFSARRSYLDFIFKAAGFGFVPEYYDVLGKLNYRIDEKRSLNFLYISAFDNVKFFNDTPDKRYSNARALGSDQIQYLSGVVYKSLFDNGFYTISLSRNFVDYDSEQRDTLLNPIFLNKSREGENILGADMVLKITKSSEINIGGDIKLIKFKADIKLPVFKTSFGDILQINSLKAEDNYLKFGLYTQYSNRVRERLHYNVGLRLDYFDALKTKFYISPRYSMSYAITDITNINLSTGIYYQSPSYIWLQADPANKDLKSVRVNQYVLGFDHMLRKDVIVKLEGFYKDYKDYPASTLRTYLVLANSGAGYTGSDDNFASFGLERLTSGGKGNVRGIEFSAQKKSSDIPHYALFSLTYSEARFTALDGVERPGNYDQRLILNLGGGFIFNEKWEMSFKFRFFTGNPYTPYNPDGSQSVENYNSKRLDPNHALDLRLDRKWNFDHYTLIAFLDVQNVYNRKNRTTVKWDERTMAERKPSSIGILPSIGISLEM
jgi:hypothetical protein